MRRVFVALAIFGLAAAAPLLARGDDKQIERQVISRIQAEKAAGRLRGFDIDLKVEEGVVWLKGRVASPEQEELLLETTFRTPGVVNVMKKLEVGIAAAPAANAAPVSTSLEQPERVANRPATPLQRPQSLRPAHLSQPASFAQQSSRRDVEESSASLLLAAPPAPTLQASVSQPASVMPQVESPTQAASQALTAYPATENAQMIINPHVGGGTKASAAISVPAPVAVVQAEPIQEPTPAPASPTLLETIRATVGGRQEESVLKTASAQQPAQAAPAAAGSQSAAPAQPQPAPVQPQLVPVNPYYAYPYGGYYPVMAQTPTPFAPAQQASAEVADAAGAAGMAAGAAAGMGAHYPAAPIHPVGAFGAAAGVRYDHPHLPPYAWPSYAAYPNYAAVTYPKQYSPTVWPYIGPFYPYPQVPLGWRKVELVWDDGWWHLDFKSQNRPWKMH